MSKKSFTELGLDTPKPQGAPCSEGGVASFDAHLVNVTDNLALIADLGYASVSLAIPVDGRLKVVAAVRSTTAVAPGVVSRINEFLDEDEIEAYQATHMMQPVKGTRVRERRGATYATIASPIVQLRWLGEGTEPTKPTVKAVIIRDIALAPHQAPGQMEQEFMTMADELVAQLCMHGLTTQDNEPFATTRRPGDGVMRIDERGEVAYPSPNAVAIMRRAGFEARVRTSPASTLPGGGFAIVPVLNTEHAIEQEISVVGRTLLYRTIGLSTGAIVFVEDVTEARRNQAALKVKDATIREVHHRVKNNLQTVASLLRMQARRVKSEEARAALAEATDRVNSMATVHAMLSQSDGEYLDFLEVTRAVVGPIKAGYAGEESLARIEVSGEQNILLDAPVATSLAIVLTELVHNAFEHGIDKSADKTGTIEVVFDHAYSSRGERMLRLVVKDSGPGLPEGFDVSSSASLGLSIVSTVVIQDLNGSIEYKDEGDGTLVEVVFPEPDRHNMPR